jgi:hypothetical protein
MRAVYIFFARIKSVFFMIFFWTVLLYVLPFYSLANPTVHAFAPPPFRGSLTVIDGERAAPSTGSGSVSFTVNAVAPLHGGVGSAKPFLHALIM